jgi:Na+/H+-dicarboxylate symporter
VKLHTKILLGLALGAAAGVTANLLTHQQVAVRPGEGLSEAVRTSLMETYRTEASERVSQAAATQFGIQTFVNIVPRNPIQAAADLDMLGLIFFSLVFFGRVRSAMITAFSTSSSNATLPTTLAVAEQELKIWPTVAGFVVPLGATMNMNGTALFEGVVVLFLAQVMGLHLSLATQAVVIVLVTGDLIAACLVARWEGGWTPDALTAGA